MFEFDPSKSVSNAEKHGIGFKEAQALWNDDDRTETPSWVEAAEERWVIVGRIGDRFWTAVVTYRENAIRIILVRRARDNETEDYLRRGV
jgi:uncharacterized protein